MKTEEKKKSNKIKISVIIVLITLLLIVVVWGVFALVNTSQDTKNNNDSNMGLAYKYQGDDFYYSYNKGLIKSEKKDEKVISKDQAYSVNIIDDNIYYTTPNKTGGIDIKKIKVDGKEDKTLLSTTSSSTKMYIQDSKIYYLTSNPDTISRMDIDGKNQTTLLSRNVTDFKVVDDVIYFSDIMGFLYSIDLNGENFQKVIEESVFNRFQILDNDVYYFDSKNNKLMKVSLKDVSKKSEVTDKLNCDIYNVAESGVYYFDKNDKKIKKVSFNGNKVIDIVKVNGENTKINVVGNKIYYVDNQNGKQVTKIVNSNGK